MSDEFDFLSGVKTRPPISSKPQSEHFVWGAVITISVFLGVLAANLCTVEIAKMRVENAMQNARAEMQSRMTK